MFLVNDVEKVDNPFRSSSLANLKQKKKDTGIKLHHFQGSVSLINLIKF